MSGAGNCAPGLGQQARAGVNPDDDPICADPSEDAAGQPARPAPEFDDAVAWADRQGVEEPLERAGELPVLDLQPPGGGGRLPEDVAGGPGGWPDPA